MIYKYALIFSFKIAIKATLFSSFFFPVITCLNIYQDISLNEMGYNNYNMLTNGESLIIEEFINPGDIIFDVGANIGEWSQKILSKNRDIKLYAFEPIPDIFTQLKRTILSPSVTLSNLALSNAVGFRKFVLYNKSTQLTQLSGFYQRPAVEQSLNMAATFLTVPTDTIDHFCKEHAITQIDFLKIDTEGAELIVLQGALDMLQQNKIKTIQFEYGGTYLDSQTTLRQVYELLSQNGYTIFRIILDGLIQIEKWHDELENYQYSNYLAICDDAKSRLLPTLN
jgi:FkbM family methyltransferase